MVGCSADIFVMFLDSIERLQLLAVFLSSSTVDPPVESRLITVLRLEIMELVELPGLD